MDVWELKVLIKSAGEQATGIAHRLYKAGLTKIVMLDIEKPLTVRRFVAFSEAIERKEMVVEGVKAVLCSGPHDVHRAWEERNIAVLIDGNWESLDKIRPHVVVDAILAKRNLGTRIDEAPLVIGVGPGFRAKRDVHVVIESKRGHNLGRVIYEGEAEPPTDFPDPVMGFSRERVLRAPKNGRVKHVKQIGDLVKGGEVVLFVDSEPVFAQIGGVLRGLIREMEVREGEKVGDIDPRGIREYCFTISDRARAIGGGVLEAIMHEFSKRGERWISSR